MSRTKRHKSQISQGIEWGGKRIGDKGYHGIPCHDQKKRTSRAERLHRRRALINELTHNDINQQCAVAHRLNFLVILKFTKYGKTMEQLLFLLAGIIIGYILTGYKFVRNSNEIQRIEFMGKLYKVLKHDDPIFEKAEQMDGLAKIFPSRFNSKY